MASPQKLIHAMQIIMLAYPKMTVSQDTWAIYMAALSDIPNDDLLRAVTECIIHDPDFPTIARLRELALVGRYPSEYEAWLEVKDAFRHYGADDTPEWSHPLIGKAVDSLGWAYLCQAQIADEPLDRANFQKAYRAFVMRDSYDLTSLAERMDATPLLGQESGQDVA
jgi:hypothetical protein